MTAPITDKVIRAMRSLTDRSTASDAGRGETQTPIDPVNCVIAPAALLAEQNHRDPDPSNGRSLAILGQLAPRWRSAKTKRPAID
jgi:hypothetical protein